MTGIDEINHLFHKHEIDESSISKFVAAKFSKELTEGLPTAYSLALIELKSRMEAFVNLLLSHGVRPGMLAFILYSMAEWCELAEHSIRKKKKEDQEK